MTVVRIAYGVDSGGIRLVAYGISKNKFARACDIIFYRHFNTARASENWIMKHAVATGNKKEINDAIDHPLKIVAYYTSGSEPKIAGIFDLEGNQIADK